MRSGVTSRRRGSELRSVLSKVSSDGARAREARAAPSEELPVVRALKPKRWRSGRGFFGAGEGALQHKLADRRRVRGQGSGLQRLLRRRRQPEIKLFVAGFGVCSMVLSLAGYFVR